MKISYKIITKAFGNIKGEMLVEIRERDVPIAIRYWQDGKIVETLGDATEKQWEQARQGEKDEDR